MFAHESTLMAKRVARHVLFFVLSALLVGIVLFPAMVGAQGPSGKVTVEIWTPWGGAAGELLEEIIGDFEAMHPNIDVVHNFLSYSEREKLVVAYAAGTAPDVAAVYQADMFYELQQSGVWAPFDEYMARRGVSTDVFFPAMVDLYRVDGKYWALPHAAVAMSGWVTYNKERFRARGLPDQVPDTWSELLEASRHLTEQSSDRLVQIPMEWIGHGGIMSANLVTNQAPWVEDGVVRFDIPEVREILEFATNYTRQVYGSWEQYEAFLSNFEGRGCDRAFYKGDVAMTGHIEVAMRNCGVEMDHGIGLFPRNGAKNHDGARVVATPGWSLTITKNEDKDVEYAAYLLAEYLTIDADGGGRFMLEQGRLSPLIEINKDPHYYEVSANWDLQLQAMSKAVSFPNIAHADRLRGILGQMFDRALRIEIPADQNIAQAIADWRSVQSSN